MLHLIEKALFGVLSFQIDDLHQVDSRFLILLLRHILQYFSLLWWHYRSLSQIIGIIFINFVLIIFCYDSINIIILILILALWVPSTQHGFGGTMNFIQDFLHWEIILGLKIPLSAHLLFDILKKCGKVGFVGIIRYQIIDHLCPGYEELDQLIILIFNKNSHL